MISKLVCKWISNLSTSDGPFRTNNFGFMGTITKALGLLDQFSVSTPELGLAEFQRRSGYDKATVYRHLCALVEMGFLEQDGDTRSYRLGPAILRLAGLRELTFPVRDALAPIIDDLSLGLGELVHASMLQGDELMSVYHHEPHVHGLRVRFDGVERLPLNATATGLVVLAFQDDASLERLLPRRFEITTKNSIKNRKELLPVLEKVRTCGYSTSSEIYELGVASVSIPIFDKHQLACGGVSVAYPTTRGGKGARRKIVRELKSRGAKITEQIGGIVPVRVLDLWQ